MADVGFVVAIGVGGIEHCRPRVEGGMNDIDRAFVVSVGYRGQAHAAKADHRDTRRVGRCTKGVTGSPESDVSGGRSVMGEERCEGRADDLDPKKSLADAQRGSSTHNDLDRSQSTLPMS
jgi:hypothetical protein